MAAIPKPHRIAVLVPDVTIDGADAAYEREAAVLLWTACIEICQRHPRLSVLDADATPLFPQEGHFAPQYAGPGGRPTDAFFGPTRRDEVIWLELALGTKPGAVRLHVIGRDGKQESFDALGRSIGDQIQQVLASWFTARGLGASLERFEPVTADDILAVVRVIAPTLVEQARAWALPVATRPTWSLAVVEDDDAADTQAVNVADVLDEISVGPEDDSAPLEVTIDSTLDSAPIPEADDGRRRSIVRPLVNRLPQTFRLPALRLLELALREDLADAVLAVEPDHPQALFARYEKLAPHGKDFALLRQVIANAPGWARPYEELDVDSTADDPIGKLTAPTQLESVASAGVAAICRPAALHALESAADRLAASGRIDEGLRLVERAAALQHDDPRAHIALMHLHEQTDREGARLDQALRSASLHGCPMDPVLPWYADQIHIDLRTSSALLEVGRLDEAIALRANRLDGRESAWPNHTRVLASWRRDPRFVAWCYAREGWFRGDDARAIEGFGRAEPADSLELAIFLDALVAVGREAEVPFAWAQFGLGLGADGAVARLAAATALAAAGEWRRGLEELWRVQLADPGRDEHVAIARCGLAMSVAPIEVIEAALGERIANGATTLAARMARDIADFVPTGRQERARRVRTGARSLVEGEIVADRLRSELARRLRSRHPQPARDRCAVRRARYPAQGPPSGFDLADELARGDRLVDRWLEVAFTDAGDDDPAALAQAAAYTAAQALARYFAATTTLPTTLAGALRTVASEALALVRKHRAELGDREARAVFGALESLLRRVDRWIGATWLATVERALRVDERSAGDVAGFVRDYPTVAARILGPEETAALSWSVARLHRDRPDGWAAKVVAQASRLAAHTGRAGVDEWSDAIVAQLASRELDLDDAIDALHTACYLADGVSAVPCVHAARVLFDAGRAPAAFVALCSGLRAATPEWRDSQLALLADSWRRANLDVPIEFDRVAAGVFESLQHGDPARAERLARWAIAYDPYNAEAHRNLGLALAQQGKTIDAMHHLVRGTSEQAAQILSGVLYQAGKLPEAMAVLDYASRWYTRADQWLTYGGIAYAALDNARTATAYRLAYQLDPGAFDASQLNAFAGALDEVGDYATCERVAEHLLRVAGDDLMWKTNGWNHLACAYVGLGRFDEATALAERAVGENPVPENVQAFAVTLARAKARTKPTGPPATGRGPVDTCAIRSTHSSTPAITRAPPRDSAIRAGVCGERRCGRHDFGSRRRIRSRSRPALARRRSRSSRTRSARWIASALLARCTALLIREQAYFASDPVPRLGDRMTREGFYQEFRARGGVVIGEDAPPPTAFVDRVVVAGGKVSRTSDYVALLRDLAALAPREALAQFDLDEAGYLEVARAWAAAMDADPTIARTITAGLAKR